MQFGNTIEYRFYQYVALTALAAADTLASLAAALVANAAIMPIDAIG